MMREVADVLLHTGAVVHGGGVVAFALLLNLRSRMSNVPDEMLIRVYRAWGAGNGLSMALWVYGTVIRWPGSIQPDKPLPWAFSPNFSTYTGTLASVSGGLLALLWVSYILLEIWTLDDCRLTDQNGEITDRPRFDRAFANVTRHIAFNALIVVAIAVLTGLGGTI